MSPARRNPPSCASAPEALDPRTRAVYCRALLALEEAEAPFLVGGAYAFERYTGIARHTKDFDIFVHPRDFERVRAVLAEAGYATELTFPHWLGKAYAGDDFVDIIFSSGNGIARVDSAWFAHAVPAEVLGLSVKLIPAEEMIWSKAFIMERERYDGADIAHVLRARGDALDWKRLLRRFGPNWRVLLSHLLLFGFAYPAERAGIPGWVTEELLRRLSAERAGPAVLDPACLGPLLSRSQYRIDIEKWGYEDPRLQPRGAMTPEERAIWTAAAEEEGR